LILSAAKFRLVSGLCCAVTSILKVCLRGEPDLPGHGAGGFVQVALAAVARERQLHQHALRQAAVQVELHHIAPGRARQHAAAVCQQVLALQPR
jgi:hypothetical protein